MPESEEARLEEVAALILKARELSHAHGAYRLRVLMDMVAFELGREIARLAGKAPDTSDAGPTS